MRTRPMFFLLLVFLLALIGGIVFLRVHSQNKQLNSIKQTLKENVYSQSEISETGIGENPGTGSYNLSGITDGKIILDDIPILDNSGQTILISKMAFRVYYLDKNDSLQSVLVSMLGLTPESTTVSLDSAPIDGRLTDAIAQRSTLVIRGRVVSIPLVVSHEGVDSQLAEADRRGVEVSQMETDRLNLLKAYIDSYRYQLQLLVDDGEPIDVPIFPAGASQSLYGPEPRILEFPDGFI